MNENCLMAGVRRLVDLVGRTLERIALDGARELLAEAGRARVVSEQQHVAGRGQQVIVPAHEELVAPHAVRPAVHHHEQRIFLRRIETRRPHDEAVDALATAAGEPEGSRWAAGRAARRARALNLVSTSALPFCGVISAISPGELALSQFAYSASLLGAGGMVRLV